MRKTSSSDPFADDQQPTNRVKTAERSSYVEATVTPLPNQADLAPAVQGALVPYTRVADLAPDLRLVPLEEIQAIDLFLFRYDKYHSTENDADFLCMEVALVDNPEDRFLTNCGGQTVIKKVENAFSLIADGKVVGPLVASFRKIATTSGRSLWLCE